MDAMVREPSTRLAVTTAAVLLVAPLATFALAAFAMFKSGVTEPGWSSLLAVYAVGTLPALILGARYPASPTARWLFGLAYTLVCAGFLFVIFISIGCWLTDVCL
jgi:hypothetical protein